MPGKEELGPLVHTEVTFIPWSEQVGQSHPPPRGLVGLNGKLNRNHLKANLHIVGMVVKRRAGEEEVFSVRKS